MPADTLTIYSSIKQPLIKRALLKGSSIAFFGMLPLIYSTLYIGPGPLSYIGMALYFFGLAMIAVGMVPYRNLTFLERHPHKLALVNNEGLIYFHKGKQTLTVPLSKIEALNYFEGKETYGIAIRIKRDVPEKIIVHNPSFNVEEFQRLSQKGFGCDLFLQYFSKRSFQQIEENL